MNGLLKPLLTCIICLTAAMPWLHAQEPLFIDKEGNVYIKVKEGNKKFSVAGKAEFLDSVQVAGMVKANQLTVTGNAVLSDSVKMLGRLSVDGNSYVRGNATVTGTSFLNGNVGIGVAGNDANLLFPNTLKNRKIVLYNTASNDHQFYGFGIQGATLQYQVDGAAASHVFFAGAGTDKSRELMRLKGDGRVTIGTGESDAATKSVLEVKGDIIAATLNGEKKSYTFNINPDNVRNKRHSYQVSGDLIKSYFADADGGTFTIILRGIENSTDNRARVISERIYLRPPLANGSIGGYTMQLGGGHSEFTLNTNNKADMIPNPFGWIWMRNYHSRDTDPKQDGAAWQGNDAYKVEFFTTENVSATVIIYDH